MALALNEAVRDDDEWFEEPDLGHRSGTPGREEPESQTT